MKLKKLRTADCTIYTFWCVGCQQTHIYEVKDDNSGWTFNGDMENPTFSPSLLYNKCHLFLRDGVIEFLPDCRHRYAGRKIPLEDF